MEFSYDHVGLSVADLDASIAWYRDMLGFALDRQYAIEAIPARVAELSREGMRIELFEPAHAQPLPEDRRHPNRDILTHGHKHVAYQTGDLPFLIDRLRARGADIVWVKTFPWGSNAFIRDNSGNLIEFLQATPAKAAD